MSKLEFRGIKKVVQSGIASEQWNQHSSEVWAVCLGSLFPNLFSAAGLNGAQTLSFSLQGISEVSGLINPNTNPIFAHWGPRGKYAR